MKKFLIFSLSLLLCLSGCSAPSTSADTMLVRDSVPEIVPAPAPFIFETAPETKPETEPETEPAPETETAPATETAPQTETVPETEPAPTRAADPESPIEYVLNTSSKKIHKTTCKDVAKIADKNYKTTTDPSACLASGYTNCAHCGGYQP